MVVETSWLQNDGVAVNFAADVQLVSRNIGILRLMEKAPSGQDIILRRQQFNDVWKSTRARLGVEIEAIRKVTYTPFAYLSRIQISGTSNFLFPKEQKTH